MKLLYTVLGVVLWPFKIVLSLIKWVTCNLFGFWCTAKKEAVKEVPDNPAKKANPEAKKNKKVLKRKEKSKKGK